MSKMQQTHRATPSVRGVGKAGRQQQKPGKVPQVCGAAPKPWSFQVEKALNDQAWSDSCPGPEQEAELHISRGRFPLEFSFQPTSAYNLT